MLTIESLGFHIPENQPEIEKLRERTPHSANELKVLRRLYGLNNIAESDRPIGAMLEDAIGDLMANSGVAADDVVLLIHTHTAFELMSYPNGLLDRVRRRLGLERAISFGMHSNNCASVLSALKVARSHLAGLGPRARAIVVTGDLAFTDILHTIPNTTVCGDAAVACLVSLNDPAASGAVLAVAAAGATGGRLLSLEFDTFGAHAGGAWQDAAGQRTFEALYAARLAAVMDRARTSAGLAWDQIRWVFPHNVNVISWRKVAAELGLPIGRIYLESLASIGHCFGADIFINWARANAAGLIEPGEHVMLATVGIGAVFAAGVLQQGQG